MAQPLSPKMDWPLANALWAQALNPILANAILSGTAVLNRTLVSGTTTFNHGLGRMMQGYFITDIDGPATIYRSAPFNASTLTLTSDALVIANLWVY